MKYEQAFAIGVLLFLAAPFCTAQDSDALRVEVTIPHGGDAIPVLHWSNDGASAGPHIHIVLRNISKKPQPVWASSFPAVEIMNAAGKKWTSRGLFFSNDGLDPHGDGPDARWIAKMRKLPPGGTIVFDMFLRQIDWSNPTDRVMADFERPFGSYFYFAAGYPEKGAYPGGTVTLWISCRVNVADEWLGDGINANPVKCIIE